MLPDEEADAGVDEEEGAEQSSGVVSCVASGGCGNGAEEVVGEDEGEEYAVDVVEASERPLENVVVLEAAGEVRRT